MKQQCTSCKTFILLSFIFAIIFSNCKKDDVNDYDDEITYGSVYDLEGNEYKTVIIGNQEWMAENLRTTKYNNGAAIPNITSSSDWSILTTDAYAWYNNDEASFKDDYGALYNWFAVNTGNLCPTGWHVPTDAEWTALEVYVGGGAGTKLKATSGWDSGGNGTNEYGFSALPGGGRYFGYGYFGNMGVIGAWWSSTEYDATHAYYRYLHYYSGNLTYDYHNNKMHGFSVRCVRDN